MATRDCLSTEAYSFCHMDIFRVIESMFSDECFITIRSQILIQIDREMLIIVAAVSLIVIRENVRMDIEVHSTKTRRNHIVVGSTFVATTVCNSTVCNSHVDTVAVSIESYPFLLSRRRREGLHVRNILHYSKISNVRAHGIVAEVRLTLCIYRSGNHVSRFGEYRSCLERVSGGLIVRQRSNQSHIFSDNIAAVHAVRSGE